MRAVYIFLLWALTNHSASAPALARQADQPGTSAGISRLVETRAGRRSCWGVIIQPGRTRFKKRVKKAQIDIRDGKHGHDLKEMMNWRVDRTRKRLIIEFKPGMGDFGSGNRMEVRIDRSAFSAPVPTERSEWSIATDR